MIDKVFFQHVTLNDVQKSDHTTKGRQVAKTLQTSTKKFYIAKYF